MFFMKPKVMSSDVVLSCVVPSVNNHIKQKKAANI